MDIVVRQPMAGIHLQPQLPREARSLPKGFDLFPDLLRLVTVGIGSGVQLDGIGAHFVRGADLTTVRVDEQADRNLRVMEQADQGGEPFPVFRHRKPAFGGQFLSPFRNQRDFIGPDAQRNLRGRVVRGHFQIQSGRNHVPKQVQVPFLDVSTIFTEMHDQAVRAAQVREHRRGNGVRLMPAPGLPERSDVVDVDAEPSPISLISLAMTTYGTSALLHYRAHGCVVSSLNPHLSL